MKALTLHQPWATLVAIGAKSIETRSWSTGYRGPLAIHAGARRPPFMGIGPYSVEPIYEFVRHVEGCYCDEGEIDVPCARRSKGRMALMDDDVRLVAELPLGAVVASCRLMDVVPTENVEFTEMHDAAGPYLRADGVLFVGERERALGDFSPGRFAWLLADVVPLDPPVPARGRQRLWNLGPGWNRGAA